MAACRCWIFTLAPRRPTGSITEVGCSCLLIVPSQEMCYLYDIYMISLFLGECKGLLGKPFARPTNCAASLLKSLPLTSWVKQHRPRLCMSEAQQRQEKTQRNEQQESGKAGKRSQKEAMRCHSEQLIVPRQGHTAACSEIQAIAKPSEVAKHVGTPKRWIVTRPAVGARALRASRASQERR